MHNEAFAFVKQFATAEAVSVIDIGARDINGNCRALFPNALYTGLDLYAGPSVDWVGSALEYHPPDVVDIVICCEVLEHSDEWYELVTNAACWLKPLGKLIVTCAGPGRAAHSHHDGGELRDGEYYGNLLAVDLRTAIEDSGLHVVICHSLGTDTQAMAINI